MVVGMVRGVVYHNISVPYKFDIPFHITVQQLTNKSH